MINNLISLYFNDNFLKFEIKKKETEELIDKGIITGEFILK